MDVFWRGENDQYSRNVKNKRFMDSDASMTYTIGIIWYYYTKAWYSIGIVDFLKIHYTLYWNYTNYLDCGNIKTGSFKQTVIKPNSK